MPKIIYTSEQKYDGYLRVNSCGKEWNTGRDSDMLRPNGRVDFYMHYILKGVGYLEIDGENYTIPAGSLVLYFPNVRQHYSFKKKDEWEICWSHFSGTACEQLKNLFSKPTTILEIKDRKQFESVFEKMLATYYQKPNFYETICAGYMTILIALVMQSKAGDIKNFSKATNENLERVLSLMYQDYNKPIDIKKYAKICCVSEDHFIRIFKVYTGLPPYNYQLKIRINRAIEMLENTPVTISQCAEIVGFHDSAYFSKIFKRFTGHSPSYYKK